MKTKNWRDLEITEKQKRFISVMQEFVDEPFYGTTRGEAADYINRNIDELQLAMTDNYCLERGYF